MTLDTTIAKIAQVAHEANRAYCMTIGDNSQPSWDDAPQWQQDSAIDGVRAVFLNPDVTPEESHESWLKFKQRHGWVYGPVKDLDAKQHPCMVPYSKLHPEMRAKDALFTAVVRALMEE